MKTIVFFLPNLAGGGAERVAIDMMSTLYNNHKIILILQENKGEYFGLENCHNKIILKSRKTLISITHLYLVLWKLRPDVTISFMNTTNLVALITNYLLPKKKKTKTIITCHNNIEFEIAQAVKQLKGRIRIWLMGIFFRKSNALVCVSKGTKDKLIECLKLKGKKISVIYNPIDIKKIRNDTTIQEPFHKKCKIIVTAARLNPPKDFLTLFKAVREVIYKYRLEVKLMILGDGDEREKLEEHCKDLGIQESVYFAGFVENPHQYMKFADLFVLSSHYEGFGNVLVEAMACGLPVISSNAPTGPSEILEGGRFGQLFKVGDYIELSKKVVEILSNNDLRNKFSESSMGRADSFEKEGQVKKYIKLINSLCEPY